MTILNLDCRDGLALLPDNSVDSIVCDPPYGISFMGKKWDCDVPGVDIWIECLRVLKPGGYLLAFAGTRTQHRMAVRIEDAGFEIRDIIAWVYGSGFPKHQSSLKPAFEPITLARKPAKTATLLNIDACRIGNDIITTNGAAKSNTSALGNFKGIVPTDHIGRYPANFIHDGSSEIEDVLGDSSRFFYCPKTSKQDRDEGCGHLVTKQYSHDGGLTSIDNAYQRNASVSSNHHPTVKPTDLMRYLCKLVTPPAGLIVDPFAGSGSTGRAAALEGFQFLGFELDAQYAEIAQARIDSARGGK